MFEDSMFLLSPGYGGTGLGALADLIAMAIIATIIGGFLLSILVSWIHLKRHGISKKNILESAKISIVASVILVIIQSYLSNYFSYKHLTCLYECPDSTTELLFVYGPFVLIFIFFGYVGYRATRYIKLDLISAMITSTLVGVLTTIIFLILNLNISKFMIELTQYGHLSYSPIAELMLRGLPLIILSVVAGLIGGLLGQKIPKIIISDTV
ncbi:MAG: hypothetical protein Q7S22_08410 [Candidatus Micrarchaeota archaeon]|nr:hypothetical protein [Candidatus Micrarchaeota archaeon]